MELALQNFINSASKLTDVTNLDAANPFILVLTSNLAGTPQKFYSCVSTKEPTSKSLPINGIWLNFDPESKYYRTALKLVGWGQQVHPSHVADVANVVTDSNFFDSWVTVATFADIFTEVSIPFNGGSRGPQGLRGPQGAVGTAGDDAIFDMGPVIVAAVAQYEALRGF